jgi:DnaA-homolog protein
MMTKSARANDAAGQLALPLRLADHAVFESYWAPPDDTLVAFLERLAAEPADGGCWIWGPAAAGKTHLLQAVCDRLGDEAMYLPLELLAGSGPALLEGLASRRCLCLDDLDVVAGQPAWEEALFALLNELADRRGTVVASARGAPRESGIELPDLKSRLSRLPVFHLRPLAEPERVAALQLRAGHRGLELPEETARYMLRRGRRDMASLYAMLEGLDAESLKAQRRLTIPFVRDVLRRL